MSQDFFKCLVCHRFFGNLWKVETHIKIHNDEVEKHQAALSSGGVRRRGMLPIEKVTFYECLIPVVKNQIDPNFLAQYSEVQAKEEIQGVSPGLEISDSEKPDEVVELKPRRSRLQAAINIRKTTAILKIPDQQEDITPEQNDDMDFIQDLIGNLSDSDDDFDPGLYINQKFGHPKRKVGRPIGSVQKTKSTAAPRSHSILGTTGRRKRKKSKIPLFSHACDHCPEKFSIRNGLLAHLYEAHKDVVNMITCPISTCNKPFLSFFSLRDHLKHHIVAEQYEHSIQEKLDKPGDKSDSDEDIPEKKTNFKCKFCLDVFPSSQGVQLHYSRKHQEIDILKCPCCDTVSDDVLAFIGHIKSYHTERLDPFEERAKLKEKERLADKPFKCDKCSASFNIKYKLDSHLAYHAKIESRVIEQNNDPSRIYECPVCKKRFKHKDNLRRHFNLHLENNPFSCDFPNCNKKFNSDYNLRRHKELHSGPREKQRVRCPLCDATFSRRDKLPTHLRTVHGPDEINNPEAKKKARYKIRLPKCPRLSRIKTVDDLTKGGNVSTSTESNNSIPATENQDNVPSVKREPDSTTDEIHLTDRIILDPDGNAVHIKGEQLLPVTTTVPKPQENRLPQSTDASEDDSTSSIEFRPTLLSQVILSDPVVTRLSKENPDGLNDVLRFNYNTYHKDKNFDCNICGASFSRAWTLQLHLKTTHNKTIMEQEKESNEPNDNDVLNDRAKVTLLCGLCAYPGKDAADLNNHMKTAHETKIRCPICGIPFRNRARLALHVQEIHHNNSSRSFKCKVCNSSFTTKSYLYNHERRVHLNSDKVEKKKCPVKGCGRMLAPSSLKMHVWRHNRSKIESARSECKLCGDNFSCQMALRRHIDAIHLGKPVNVGQNRKRLGLLGKGSPTKRPFMRRGPKNAGDDWFLPLLEKVNGTTSKDTDKDPPVIVQTPETGTTNGQSNADDANESDGLLSILGF